MNSDLGKYLLETANRFNHPSFIDKDPISIPKRFSKLQDIEISGFWIAMLAWGQRITIINKGNELIQMMDNAPHDFILNHKESDRKKFLSFKHRTFNDIDTLFFLERLQQIYQSHTSLESVFVIEDMPKHENIEAGLIHFHKRFFDHPDAPHRTKKHVATPVRKSTCKRLNMFLRWMVRKDKKGVDFGLWNQIRPSQLIIPLDVHVERIARSLGLITRKQTDWLTALELTSRLKEIKPEDPVLFDYALFGLGILEKEKIKS